jgi:hypothetical protein
MKGKRGGGQRSIIRNREFGLGRDIEERRGIEDSLWRKRDRILWRVDERQVNGASFGIFRNTNSFDCNRFYWMGVRGKAKRVRPKKR